MLASLVLAPGLLLGCGGDPPEPSPEPEQVYVHAPGIRLTRLTLNQGVQVELVDGRRNGNGSGEKLSASTCSRSPPRFMRTMNFD